MIVYYSVPNATAFPQIKATKEIKSKVSSYGFKRTTARALDKEKYTVILVMTC
jgi:hypothetical protein